LDAPPAPLAEPLDDERLFGDLDREEHLAGRLDLLRVELAEESREDLPFARAPQAVEEERLPPEEPPPPHEEDLDAGLRPLARQAEDVQVLRLGRDDLLALADRVERLDPVAQHRGPLVLLLGRRLLHLVG